MQAKHQPRSLRARSGLPTPPGVSTDYSWKSYHYYVEQGKGSLKPATAINVRHILCEKHSKAMEAMEKIQVRGNMGVANRLMTHASRTQGGQRFDKVAQEYSEDKAKGKNQEYFPCDICKV